MEADVTTVMSTLDCPLPTRDAVAQLRRTVDTKFLAFVLGLVGFETWYLLTQAADPLLPAIWMVPTALVLLMYAVDQALVLAISAAVLFAGRLLFMFVLLLTPMDQFLLTYAALLVPANVCILLYAFWNARRYPVDGAGA